VADVSPFKSFGGAFAVSGAGLAVGVPWHFVHTSALVLLPHIGEVVPWQFVLEQVFEAALYEPPLRKTTLATPLA
jgi:hypothetical protein